jgi:hypothetical protein
MKVLRALMPVGPSIRVKLRIEGNLGSAGLVSAGCVSIGNFVASLGDFASLANVFTRFTITHAKFTVLPLSGFLLGVNGYRYPMAIGYFNDGAAAAAPASYTVVLED